MSRKKTPAKVFDSVHSVQLDSNLQVTPQCTATCKGIALIVSDNCKETDNPLPGTNRDSDVMMRFFSALGNYEVVVPKKNLGIHEFTSICKHLASLEYPEVYKRMVIYFAGHGGNGYIALQDKRVHIEDIQAIFDPSKHPKLYVMARIFFIDACRGSARYTGDDHTRGGPDKKSYQVHCKCQNELIAYSTLKGYAAYDGESWTQTLYECLVLERYMQDDLVHVLTYVNNELDSRQTAPYQSTLRELVYFWKESGLLTDSAVVDVGDNEEANETAVSETATAQSSSEQLLIEEQPNGSGGGGGSSDATVQQCTDNQSLSAPFGQISLQATGSSYKKLIYVVHRSDIDQWVKETLGPILIELNTDMTTPNDFTPGMTPGQAHDEAVSKAHTTIVVFSKLAVEDKQSKEQKWFNFAVSKAECKDPDPSVITIIPVLHGDIPPTSLPAAVKNIVPLKSNDPQFKTKIKKSIFHDYK